MSCFIPFNIHVHSSYKFATVSRTVSRVVPTVCKAVSTPFASDGSPCPPARRKRDLPWRRAFVLLALRLAACVLLALRAAHLR